MLSYGRFENRENRRVTLMATVHNQAWDVTGVDRVEYIEALYIPKHSADSEDDEASKNDENDHVVACQHGRLVGDEVLDWVAQRGKYAPSSPQLENNKSPVGIRLLVLERDSYRPPSFRIKQETYQAIERCFSLPENSLLALSSEGGVSTYTLDAPEFRGPTRLSMVFKAPQKFQIGNYGLAYSYDSDTQVATGILHGTGLTQDGNDYGLWSAPAAAEIFAHIQATRHLWDNPLCLPVMVMQHHLLRTEYFINMTLAYQALDVQRQLGVVRSGRLTYEQPRDIAAELPVRQAKVNLAELTVKLSGLMFDAVHCGSVAEWECSCMTLLLEAQVETEKIWPYVRRKETRPIRSKILYLASLAEGTKRYVVGLKESGQADMSILHSVISQVDNRLNARLAAASSYDSAAMKILAFLTALFLPGTFVATIFSTDFFDWQAEKNGRVVSELFWVFWVFTIPLTIVVAVGWRLWWGFEKKRFDEDVKAEIKATNVTITSSVGEKREE